MNSGGTMKTSHFILLIMCLICIDIMADGTRVSFNVPDEIETIQEAIEEAVDGDVIIVSPGTYYENINFLGKEIIVASMYYTTQDTSYISQTVIDGDQNSAVVTFNSNETSNSVLSGFTITNGGGSDGGGIYCDDYASPMLENLKVIDNQAANGGGLYFGNNSTANLTASLVRNNNSTSNGGGAYLYYCDLIMDDVVFDSNDSNFRGGGICCTSSNLTMQNVDLINNSANYVYSSGGGLDNYWDSTIIIDSCLIDGNTARTGGGILCDELATLSINNSIIRNNQSSNNGGGIKFSWGVALSIENSEVVNNYSGNEGGGIHASANNVSLNNVLIADNSSENKGGGIFLNGWSEIDLINTTITGNTTSGTGGGLYCDNQGNEIMLINDLVWNNSPQSIYLYCESTTNPQELVVANSDIYGGYDAIEYFDINCINIHWLEGNIDEEPQFVDEDNGNYQLVSSSPCIDSGTAYFEYNGFVLIDLIEDEYEGNAPDMGAYEFRGIRYGDINNDNVTDSYDASLLLMYVVGIDPLEDDPIPWEYWRMERADVDLNSELDALDAALVLQNAVGLIELPVMGGIRAENGNITISHDDTYIYFNSGSKVISCEFSISNSSNLKFGSGEVSADNCLYQQNCERMAIISAAGISGMIAKIPYTLIDNNDGSFIALDLACNGFPEQIEYNLNGEAPLVSRIKAVYPNPFNPETTIEYLIAQPGNTCIEVYNIRGQKLETLFNQEQKAGEYSFKWNAQGQGSGVYFVRITSGSFEDMEKAILLK